MLEGIKKHIYTILIVAIVLTVPICVAFGKYENSNVLAEDIKITVALEYTIDKALLQAALSEQSSYSPSALVFAKGTDVPEDATCLTYDGIQAEGSGKICLFEDGNTLYVAPAKDIFPAKTDKVMYAPEDSSDLLSGEAKYTNMNGCLKSVDCSNLDTSRVINMAEMFYDLTNLTTVNVTSFDTTNVVDMNRLFYGCNALTAADISSFKNSSKLVSISYLFYKCYELETVNISDDFCTENVKFMDEVFSDCKKLKSVNLSGFRTSNVISFDWMFYNCLSLESIDVTKFDTSSATVFEGMFCQCRSITTLDLSSFDNSSCTKPKDGWHAVFNACYNLRSITLPATYKFLTDYSGEDLNQWLPEPDSKYIEGATGVWYDSKTGLSYTPSQLATYHNNLNETRTYVAVLK